MIINNEYIKNFRTLNIVFSNGDEFKIPIQEIVEINCKTVSWRSKRKKVYK